MEAISTNKMFGSMVHPIKRSDDIDISGKRTKHSAWVLMIYVTEMYLKPSLTSTKIAND